MISSRSQHLIPASAIFAVSAVVAWLSFTQEPADAFLFPRVISVFFLGLAGWNFTRAALGLARVGDGVPRRVLKNIAPGLSVMLIFVFFLAGGLGFYVGSALAFAAIYTLYDPAPVSDLRAWRKRIVVTVLFMTVIYGLFALLLKVQTPRGFFF